MLYSQAKGSKEEAEVGGESWKTGREGFLEAVTLQLDLKAQGEFRYSEECAFQLGGSITTEVHRHRKKQECLIISKENKPTKAAEGVFGNLS